MAYPYAPRFVVRECMLRFKEGGYKATWKRELKLPWRKAGLLISMIKWTRTSRLSIKISLSMLGFRFVPKSGSVAGVGVVERLPTHAESSPSGRATNGQG